MPTDVEIRCACGKVRGIVSKVEPGEGNRGICYCDDCQSFAHFLGRADTILDERGGTPIFQIAVGRITFTQGSEHLACMRLTPKGLLRWYAGCCRTPIGNTSATPAIPTVGLVEQCLTTPESRGKRDDVLGPMRFHVFSRFARRPKSETASGVSSGGGSRESNLPIGAALRMLRLVLQARMRGDRRRSPFFDSATGTPRATPRVLTPDELRAVVAARDAV
jgi:hypothetical protein